jgi:hypothetical protein
MPRSIPIITAGIPTTIGEKTAYHNGPDAKPLAGITNEGPFSDFTPMITYLCNKCP